MKKKHSIKKLKSKLERKVDKLALTALKKRKDPNKNTQIKKLCLAIAYLEAIERVLTNS